MNKTAIFALVLMTLGGATLAYSATGLFTTIHVTVHPPPPPTPASITATPSTIDVDLDAGESTQSTITLHNSGETSGSVTLTLLSVGPAVFSPKLPVSFSATNTTITTQSFTVDGGADVAVIIYIGPAPSVGSSTPYVVTVNAS